MSDELAYRLVMIAGMALFAPIALYYRIRAHRAGGALDRRQEGWFILLTLRPIAVVSMAGFVAYLIAPRWMAWAHVPLPPALRWCGAPIGLLAGALIVWTFHNLGLNLTDTVVTREGATLVTRGPYRWVRHPFYVAFALAVIANSLLTANAFVAASATAAFLLIVLRTRREEEHLVRRFGDDYRDYMRRTGRFLPKPW